MAAPDLAASDMAASDMAASDMAASDFAVSVETSPVRTPYSAGSRSEVWRSGCRGWTARCS
ncbi:hypothetical protein [Streptomyces roseochromogenus]|uniref:Uncharacterized protein n=1 Tax=Streptomyces roseochromogenus subsp. oscitans DS 12.976 TaxID=1352936 RepID=V6KHU3_STRRC|nr:hypothetical protein [Streptomyces roseochromogenus]EST31021.1 hypothetical protein M878_17300 [Streptomyces roseochromogenus subsp. oscitans DS 12.976]